MAGTTIRVDERTHEMLRKLSQDEHKSIGQLVSEAVETYEQEKFWRDLEGSLAQLRTDPEAWKEYQEEIALWDTASGDGLENEEPYCDEDEASDAGAA